MKRMRLALPFLAAVLCGCEENPFDRLFRAGEAFQTDARAGAARSEPAAGAGLASRRPAARAATGFPTAGQDSFEAPLTAAEGPAAGREERAVALLQGRWDGSRLAGGLPAEAPAVSAAGGRSAGARPALPLSETPPVRVVKGAPPPPTRSLGARSQALERSSGAFASLRERFYAFQNWFSGSVASPLVSREAWGAKRVKQEGSEQRPGRIVLHHTAMLDHFTFDEERAKRFIRGIQYNHMHHMEREGRGENMRDVGYHFVISPNGVIYEARWHTERGGHAAARGGNDDSIGVALMGNFSRQQPAAAQVAALQRLMAFLAQEHRMSVQEQAFLVGHHHFERGRDCPGANLEAALHRLRASVREELAHAAASDAAKPRFAVAG